MTYPANWTEIANDIKTAAGWCCENCGHPHDVANGYCLTVHHLDMNPANCEPANLVALCQRCHLRVQATFLPGQLPLPGIQPNWMTRQAERIKKGQTNQ